MPPIIIMYKTKIKRFTLKKITKNEQKHNNTTHTLKK